MKTTLFILCYLSSIPFFCQVGVNTVVPKSSLDIVGKLGIMDIDGLLAPRLTLDQLTLKGDALYQSDQDGTIIYITDSNGGNTSGQRKNINFPGYYYFDNNRYSWQKMMIKSDASIKTIRIINTLSDNTVGPDDEVILVTTVTVGSINFPTTNPIGKTYIIRYDGTSNTTLVFNNLSYLPDSWVGINASSSSVYKNTVKARSSVTILYTGSIWIQIGGADQQ
ncbi:MAG TPA: hypothetical protein PK776_05015 [Flavobacterium sp.]|nr:hypothetical protein [Flavobacterium sp.]